MPHGISIYQNWTVVTWLFLCLVFSEFFVVDLPGQEVSVELPVEDEDTTDSVINPDLDKRAYHEETHLTGRKCKPVDLFKRKTWRKFMHMRTQLKES